jgi:alkanesulfonate monooxygenase
MLVYTDNGLVDPWLLSQLVIQNTKALSPLVAVQPIYMHPYTVAKMVSTLSYLHGRRLCLNMIAGGFKNDLAALNDETPHDRRYDRLIEYTTIIQHLLTRASPLTFEGEFYRVRQLVLKPPLAKGLFPIITISGSSEAGLIAARTLGAVAIMYPEPAGQSTIFPKHKSIGIRVGIIARKDEDEAWRIADERFPADRGGQVAHKLAMKISDSVWHRTLSDVSERSDNGRSTYWLWPFHNYKTFCPYLVGSHAQVAAEISRYMMAGYSTFILDVPSIREDLEHTSIVFAQAQEGTVV